MIIHLSKSLRWILPGFLLNSIWMAFEVFLIDQLQTDIPPYPYFRMLYWFFSFLLICLPISYWMTQMKAWVLPAVGLFYGIWISINLGIGLIRRSNALLFFSFLLTFYAILLCKALFNEFTKAYTNTPFFLKKHPSHPILPKLRCHLLEPEPVLNCKIKKIDPYGILIHLPKDSKINLNKKLPLELRLKKNKMKFKIFFDDWVSQPELTLELEGNVISVNHWKTQTHEIGIQFLHRSADERNFLNNFLIKAQTYGYLPDS